MKGQGICTFSFNSASETGFAGRETIAGGGIDVSDMSVVCSFLWDC